MQRTAFFLLGVAIVTLGLPLAAQAPQTKQSPIDIVPKAAKGEVEKPFHLHVAAKTALSLVNTGSPDENATVRALVPANMAHIMVGGERYVLKQFHFHVASEHRLNGKQYPMEVHSVFQSDSGRLAVIGRMVEFGKEDAKLATLFDQLPAAMGKTVELSDFPLAHLYPANLGYYRYQGSLTTPPYTEGVHWFVLKTPMKLSQRQIDEFAALFPDGDSRDVQPINGRRIIRSGAMVFHYQKTI